MRSADNSFDPKLAAAVAAHQQGRLAEAERLYGVVLRRRPNDVLARANLGFLYEQSGRIENAIGIYQAAIPSDPNNPEWHVRLGNAFWGAGRIDFAAESYRVASGMAKTVPVYVSLGDALVCLGEMAEAIDAYEAAVQLAPRNGGVLVKLASALARVGRNREAVEVAQKATSAEAGSAASWLGLGQTLLLSKRFSEAVDAFQRGLRLAPGDLGGHCGLTEAFLALGCADEALGSAQKADQVAPNQARVVFDLGRAYHTLKRNAEAVAAYRRSMALAPDRSEARFNLATILVEQGHLEEARAEFAAVTGSLRLAAQVRAALAVPIVVDNIEEIDAGRAATREALEALKTEGCSIEDPQTLIGAPGFFLAYHGRNNRELLALIADLMTRLVPDLEWEGTGLRFGEGRIRVGFLSVHLREHTVGRITAGLIEHLDRERFEVIVLRPPGIQDNFADHIDRLADRAVKLPADFRSARQVVADEKLDALYFPDIGMDSATYFLAFSRLAPIQCAGWGHADTTGIPNVDYFITCRSFEGAGVEDRYTERPVLLNRINTYYERPPEVFEPVTRKELGLPEDVPLYLCPQSAFKLHPDFDQAIAAILDLDPLGLVAISEGTEAHWNDRLRDRFARTVGTYRDRIVFVPRVSPSRFRGLLAMADVILDPCHFTGGHTSYLAFSVGTPVVTWDGIPLRSRMTAGLYEHMDIVGPVASSNGEFAEFAVALATDKERRSNLSKQIVERSPQLFEDVEAVRGFEQFLLSVCRPNGDGVDGKSRGVEKALAEKYFS